ncbi:GbsR/MarR family transcriptional regulator [Thalassobacillus sp. CUG 92003]|uniref:GbsR/MarR family transcriptional regulator n=1 Tax=Thalassobacillus sp. CUG 92003 TaxID=2736641 RepID=UPI0015E6E10C|nr:GbsR/MarR family transcriptional regulator [Thalassobacillus sp. CUG 92003]
MDHNEALEQSRARVIEAISQNMDLYGVTPSIGRLYCLLFFADKPLTLDEMKEQLGMSKASMSLGVRTLLDLNMVEKAWRKGVRKDLYVVNDDPYQRFFDYFSTKWRGAATMNTNAIETTIHELQVLTENPETPEEVRERAQVDIKNLENWLEYYDWLNRLIDSFESKEILEFIPIHKNKEQEE